MPMRIGAFARAAGVGIETVRYYQRRGLLEKPSRVGRGATGLYNESMLDRMAFIRRAQALGFTLLEIEKLIALAQQDCRSGKDIVQGKLSQLDARVVEINRMRAKLRRYLVLCEKNKKGEPCPFLGILSEREMPTEP